MKWTNDIHSFNLEGKRVTRADNTLVCICERKEDADKIALVPEMIDALCAARSFFLTTEPLYNVLDSLIKRATLNHPSTMLKYRDPKEIREELKKLYPVAYSDNSDEGRIDINDDGGEPPFYGEPPVKTT